MDKLPAELAELAELADQS
jgi:hypothetical protein